MPDKDEKRITVFTGHYGSGKTEIAVSYTLQCAKNTTGITLIDLDFVNPYFRSREAKQLLEQQGIDVIASTEELFDTDLPAFSRRIGGALGKLDSKVIVDLGGDEAGARAIGRFRNLMNEANYELLFVVNPYRPFTSKPSEIKTVIDQVEKASGLKVTSLVSNPNLITETSITDIVRGHKTVLETAGMLDLTVQFTAVESRFADCPEIVELGTPVLLISRRMLVPWEDH